MGILFYKQGKLNKASSCFQKTVKYNPVHEGASVNIELLKKYKESNPDKNMDILESVEITENLEKDFNQYDPMQGLLESFEEEDIDDFVA